MGENFRESFRIEPAEELAERLELPFKDYSILYRALTHRSYLNEHPEALEDNERLEFLGDAILDFFVAAWLYNHFPEMAEGDLTRLRSALVRTEQLAYFALQLQLGAAMRLGKGEDEGGGRQRTPLLCATFEALVGALYLDAGLEKVINFVEPLLESAVTHILKSHKEQDPKSMLQEWIQSQGLSPPRYITIHASGPEHNKTFEVDVLVDDQVYGHGIGSSKQLAAKAAARAALKALGLD